MGILGICHRIVTALLSAAAPVATLSIFVLSAALTTHTLFPCTQGKAEIRASGIVVVVNVEYAGRMAKVIGSGAGSDQC